MVSLVVGGVYNCFCLNYFHYVRNISSETSAFSGYNL